MKIQVSFPLNVNEIFNKKTVDLNWFNENKNVIQEIYVAPFFITKNYKDMNGENDTTDIKKILDFLYKIKELKIKICVIFNNVFSQYNNLNLQNYCDLIDWLVVPNHDWLKLKKYGFKIKNTVINLPTFEQIKNGDYDDYDLIYIHDDIIHNHDKWKNIKGNRKFGCVSNFNECVSFCKLKKKHYKSISVGNYIFDKEGSTLCPVQRMSNFERLLKRCAIPDDLHEYEYYSDVIDLFKLQGRTQDDIFYNAVQIVELLNNKIKNTKNVLKLKRFDYLQWKNKTRNCGGNCLNCDFCNKLVKKYENL